MEKGLLFTENFSVRRISTAVYGVRMKQGIDLKEADFIPYFRGACMCVCVCVPTTRFFAESKRVSTYVWEESLSDGDGGTCLFVPHGFRINFCSW